MACERATRIQTLLDQINWMHENLRGCDWCCGGGDDRLAALYEELETLRGQET